jgi:glycosyltransferase involved in cell wall biosynthesis
MKISACLIIRNEEKNLVACLESVRPWVDELCIVDTGSTDASPSIAARYADKFEVWTECNDSEGRIKDFSAARNRNLAQATGKAVLWLDGDDVLVGGQELRKAISEAPRGPSGDFQILAAYEYERDAAGRVTTLQWRERVVGHPDHWEWRGPVHEGLLGRAGCNPVSTQTEAFRVRHMRGEVGKAAEPGRNLRILRDWFSTHGEADARLMHYYGAELQLAGHHGEAMYWFRRHIATSPWSDERALSHLHLARFHLAIGDAQIAAQWALDCTAVKTWPEPLWLLGQAYCTMAEQGIDPPYNLRRGAWFLRQGMDLAGEDGKPTPTLLMTDPTARYEACAWLSAARAKLGDLAGALQWAEVGLAGAPEHPTMLANAKGWREEKAREEVRSALVGLHKAGGITREAGAMVEAILRGDFKVEKKNDPRGISSAQGHTSESAKTGKLDIVFFLGHQLEPWTPRTLEANGMGGSETMAWEMSKRLAALGHRVRVYAHCEPYSWETYDGVMWHDESEFVGVSCDVLICSRRFDAVHHAKSKAAVLWVHDVHVGEAFHPRDAVKFDFIWCLSNWHKEFFCSTYPWLSKEKVEVTRNGIETTRFSKGMGEAARKRNPHRAIYSSSPDRGLAEAVRAWPAVRAAIPDAELHVYYGFENWDKSLERGENGIPHCSRAARDALKLAVQNTPGVVMHGRVNQRELAEAMLGASVWFYPTWFSETSCITAMEAQAASLWCVAPPLAALAETVNDGNRIWSGRVVEDIAKAFRMRSEALGDAINAAEVERSFSLDTLAESWQARLNKLVADATANVAPKFFEEAR